MTKEEVLDYLNEIEDRYNNDEEWSDVYDELFEQLKEADDKELAKFILDRIYKIPFKEDIMNRQNLVVALITKLSTDEAMEYLTPEKNLEFHLTKHNLGNILRAFGNNEFSRRFYNSESDALQKFVERNHNPWGRDYDHIENNCNINLILAQSNDYEKRKKIIEHYLTPENVLKYMLDKSIRGSKNGITLLVRELNKEDRKKYLFANQHTNIDLTIANVIKSYGTEEIIDALKIGNAKKYGLTGEDINYLINSLSEEEKEQFLLPNQNDFKFGWRNVLYHDTQNEKVKSLITSMYENNQSVFIDYSELLDDEEILELVNEEMISYLSLFPKGTKFSQLDTLSKKVILKLVSFFMKENQTDEWTLVFEQIMSKYGKSEKLISSIDEEKLDLLKDDDLALLLSVILNGNRYSLQDIDDKADYLSTLEERKKKGNGYYKYVGDEFKEILKHGREKRSFKRFPGVSLHGLIGCILECKYGIDYDNARELVGSFGEDINYIQNDDLKVFIKTIDFLIRFEKAYINSIDRKLHDVSIISSELWQLIQKSSSYSSYKFIEYGKGTLEDADGIVDDRFKSIMEKVKPISNIEMINPLQINKMLKKEFMRLYNATLFSIKDAKKINETDEIYELPKDENGFVKKYNAIVTSLAAYVGSSKYIDNYYEFWNRPEISSLHFCGSYIGRRMNCTARIGSVCFGFSHMDDDSLLMSSNRDLGSSSNDIHSHSSFKNKFCSPENQLDSTDRGEEGQAYRNEMDFRRFINNKRIQPDYIVVFRIDGKISNMDEAKRAREEFLEQGIDLPILIIDKDECLRAEAYEIAGMMLEYEKNPNKELKKQIRKKISSNNKTITNIEIYDGLEYRGKFRRWIGRYVNERRKLEQEKKVHIDSTQLDNVNVDSTMDMDEVLGIKKAKSIKSEMDPIEYDMCWNYYRKIGCPPEEIEIEINKHIELNELLKSAEEIKSLFKKAEIVQSNNHSISDQHGVQHIKNVLLMANYIGRRENISEEDMAILREAVIFHDISYVIEGDSSHARVGSEWYLENVNSTLNKEEVAFLIHAHEAVSKTDISDTLLKWYNNSNIDEKRRSELIKLAMILQDADRLDVIRYDTPRNLGNLRFDPRRLNNLKNMDLMYAASELSILNKLENREFVIKDGRLTRPQPKKRYLTKKEIEKSVKELFDLGDASNYVLGDEPENSKD